MLWLKAWLETRWRLAWVSFWGAFFLGTSFWEAGHAASGGPQELLVSPLRWILLMSLLAPLTLAGSGIQTRAATRPGSSEKGAEGSTLFTLSLPVTRTWLFFVRTVTGVLETEVLLTLFFVAGWLFLPPLRLNAPDVLGSFAVIAFSSLTVYAISACLSTFCDESWRIRLSLIALVLAFVLPPPFSVVRPLVVGLPVLTHQIPWATISAAAVLTVSFFAIGLMIIQNREY